jgi:hypothetical protein
MKIKQQLKGIKLVPEKLDIRGNYFSGCRFNKKP